MTSEAHFKETVLDRMKEIMRLLFLQVRGRLEARYGCFEIFGVDFLLAEDLTPRVMEVSSCPSFSCEMDDAKPVVRTLLRDCVTLGSDLHQKNREKASEMML